MLLLFLVNLGAIVLDVLLAVVQLEQLQFHLADNRTITIMLIVLDVLLAAVLKLEQLQFHLADNRTITMLIIARLEELRYRNSST